MKTKCAAAAVRAVVTISVSTFLIFLKLHTRFSPRGLRKAHRRLAYVLLSFLSSFLTIYLVIYWTDLRQICRVGRTVAVDERSQVICLIRQGTLPWQQILRAKSVHNPYNCGSRDFR